MPIGPVAAVAIPAGIQAIGQLGGAALGSKSANKATRAQMIATQQALAFEREQEMQRRKEYEEQQARLKAEWEAYQERRRPYREAAEQLIRGAGYTPRARPTSMPTGWTPPGSSPTMASTPPSPTMTAGLSSGPTTPGIPPLTTPRFRSNWGDWENYLA